MKKKILGALCLTMAVAMTVPLAACGDGGGRTEGSWWTTEGELTKNGDEVVFDDVYINLTTIVGGADKVFMQQIIDDFNAEYSGRITITDEYLGEGTFERTVAEQLKTNAKNAPHLIMSHQRSLKSFYDYQIIQPYDLAMNETGITIDLNGFAQGVNKYSKVDTEYQFGVPIDAASMVVYYNADLLKNYSDTVPATRTELMEVCRKFKQDNPDKYPIGWDTGGDFFSKYLMPTAVLQNGGHLYGDNLKGDWYSDETQRATFATAIEAVSSYITNGYAALGKPEKGSTEDFLDDKSIFYVSMPWYRQDIMDNYITNKAKPDKGGITVTEEQVKAKIKGASVSGWFAMSDEQGENAKKIYGDSHMFAITSRVKDINEKTAICEFVKWFTQTASVGSDWADAGHVTLSNTIAASDDYNQNDNVKNFITNWYPHLDSFTPMGINAYYEPIGDAFKWLLNHALLNLDKGYTAEELRAKNLELIQTAEKDLNSEIDVMDMFK